jgi:hypothetical protein
VKGKVRDLSLSKWQKHTHPHAGKIEEPRLVRNLFEEFIEKINGKQRNGHDKGQIAKHLRPLIVAFYRNVFVFGHQLKFPVKILNRV